MRVDLDLVFRQGQIRSLSHFYGKTIDLSTSFVIQNDENEKNFVRFHPVPLHLTMLRGFLIKHCPCDKT